MIVKPVTNIKYFLENSENIDKSFTYECVWHKNQPQTSFTAMPTFVSRFKDVRAHTLPFLLTKNNLMITDHVWPLLWKVKNKPHKTHKLWNQWTDKLDIDNPKVSRQFNDEDVYVWMPIDRESSNNAWHFWIDVWSRIRLLEQSERIKKNTRNFVYIFPNMGEYMENVMKQIMKDYHYMVMPKDEYWQFKDLIVPSMSNSQDGIIQPGLPNWLFKEYAQTGKATRKIFITRDDAPARKLANTDELFMALKGWEKVNLSEMSIQEQISMFSNSSHIMGTHGAGLLNSIWAPEGAQVIEISQTELIDKKPYPILSMLKNHRHHVIYADKIALSNDKPKNVKRLKDYNNLRVDIKEVLNYL